jgi:hypothetical protein
VHIDNYILPCIVGFSTDISFPFVREIISGGTWLIKKKTSGMMRCHACAMSDDTGQQREER